MKKALLVMFVLLIGVAFVSTGFAQDKPKTTTEKAGAVAEKAVDKGKAAAEKVGEKAGAAVDKMKPAEKPAAEAAPAPDKAKEEKPAPKPKPAYKGMAGKVMAMDMAMKTMTVQDKKVDVKVDVSRPELKGYKSLEEIKVGDTVAVYYTGDAVRIQKIKGAPAAKPAKAEKPAKAAKPAKEKKAEEPKK
jgi:hypothetical protein